MIWEVLSPVLSNRHKIFSDSLQRADFFAFFEVGSNPHGSYASWELNGFLTGFRWFALSNKVEWVPLSSIEYCKAGKTRNLVGPGRGARVQIPAAPPKRTDGIFHLSFFFCAHHNAKAPSSCGRRQSAKQEKGAFAAGKRMGRVFDQKGQLSFQPRAAPRLRQAAKVSWSGVSQQITLGQTRRAPASVQRASQLLIHSPPPQP